MRLEILNAKGNK